MSVMTQESCQNFVMISCIHNANNSYHFSNLCVHFLNTQENQSNNILIEVLCNMSDDVMSGQ